MSRDVEYIGEHFAVLRGSGTIVSFAPDVAKKPVSTPTLEQPISAKIQSWGVSNLKPTEERLKLEQTTTAYPLIIKSAETLFGQGAFYYTEERTADGIKRNFTAIPAVEKFLEYNDLDTILLERWMDLRTYNNVFCEFLFNKAGTEIVNVWHHEAEFVRFGQADAKTREITEVLINSEWQKYPMQYTGAPFYDDYSPEREDILKRYSTKKKFVTHNYIPSPGRTLYAVPKHQALFEKDGWLDYSISVPKLMNAINQNGFNLRYHIEIPADYWEAVYKDWHQKTDKQRSDLKQAKMDAMNAYLQGVDNVGKNFYTEFGVSKATGKEMPGWRLTELKDPIRKDQFITSLQESDIQQARAIGVDVSLANISSGSNTMGAGSGSDKRVGMSNTISSSYAEQMIVLKFLKVVGIVNNWPRNLKWAFRYELPVTLNENKSGTQIIG